MSRPKNEAEYLARMVPPSAAATALSRRTLLRGAVGAGAAAALAACGGSDSPGGTTSSSPAGGASSAAGGSGGSPAAASGTVTLGSNEKGNTFAKQRTAMARDFEKANSGATVKLNEVDHNTFQENINNYLQGNPDDVFSWFAGYRMRFFATQDLIGDVSDVWPIEGINDAFKKASTGEDEKQYFVPQSYYPWAMFYRKSVWKANGYEVPKTLDDLTALCKQMQKDKLVPIAFGDKDGWPAMGTFDALNMRINGYDFHIALMAGEKAWDGPEVKKVFDTWKSLLPYHQTDALGRTWQEAAQSLQQKKSGMYLLGTFVNEQFPKDEADLDFFTFPEIDSNIGADAIDAPIDGFCMAKKPKNEAGAKAFLKYLASPQAAAAAATTGLPFIAANEKASTAKYSALQKKSAQLVGSAKSIAQFLDRDTRPDFASTVIIPALQTFLRKPDDIDGLVKSIESQKKSIFI